MMTRLLTVYLVVVMACTQSHGQQQGSGDSQSTSAPVQSGKAAPSKLPPLPSNVPLLTPTQTQVNNSQGPVLSAAPDATVKLLPEQGFPGLPPATGSVSISDHDVEKGQDILGDLIGQSVKDQGLGVRSPSFDSAFSDALESVSEKIGVPALVGDVLNGGSLLLDSEPTAKPALDSPDSVRYGQSVLSNLGSVAGGNPSPFGDQDLIQACDRLRSYLTQYQFELGAAAQNQVQNVIATNCTHMANIGGVQAASPSRSTQRVAPTPSPQTAPAKANPSTCPAGAKTCR